MVAFASNTVAPAGYIHCNGATISRTTYAALFAVIGTLYGAGDGSTTFSLPQLADGRFIRGEGGGGQYYGAGLPEIWGSFGADSVDMALAGASIQGAFWTANSYGYNLSKAGVANAIYAYNFNASRYNGHYGASSTVMPQSLSMKFYMKY